MKVTAGLCLLWLWTSKASASHCFESDTVEAIGDGLNQLQSNFSAGILEWEVPE